MIIFSVIITSFNRLEKLKRALNSVLNQTFTDYEIIIVDDCSTDGSVIFLKNFKHSKVNIYLSETNKGQAGATNFAVEKSSGKWLAFLDADDYWELNKLEKVDKVINESSNEFKLFYSSCFIINSEGSIQRLNKANKEGYVYKQELLNNPIGCQSRVVVEKKSYLEVGGLDESLIATKDWDLWIRITKKYKVKSIPAPLTYYEENNESISSNLSKVLEGREQFWEKNYPNGMSSAEKRISYNLFGKFLLNRGHKKTARRFFIKAYFSSFFIPSSIVYYLISFLPIGVLRLTQRIKNIPAIVN